MVASSLLLICGFPYSAIQLEENLFNGKQEQHEAIWESIGMTENSAYKQVLAVLVTVTLSVDQMGQRQGFDATHSVKWLLCTTGEKSQAEGQKVWMVGDLVRH